MVDALVNKFYVCVLPAAESQSSVNDRPVDGQSLEDSTHNISVYVSEKEENKPNTNNAIGDGALSGNIMKPMQLTSSSVGENEKETHFMTTTGDVLHAPPQSLATSATTAIALDPVCRMLSDVSESETSFEPDSLQLSSSRVNVF